MLRENRINWDPRHAKKNKQEFLESLTPEEQEQYELVKNRKLRKEQARQNKKMKKKAKDLEKKAKAGEKIEIEDMFDEDEEDVIQDE